MRVLGLVPARGGSQGVPGKNIRPLMGKSLVQRAFDSAWASEACARVILSTDSIEIQEHALEFGADCPFLRPAELATSESGMMGVVLHALGALAHDEPYDAVLLLQPTSPLRKPEHIRAAVALLGQADSVCTVIPIPKTHCPHYVMKITEQGTLDHFLPDGAQYIRRQDVPQAYTREGTIFLARTELIQTKQSFYGPRCFPLVLDPSESLSIDTEEDWKEAEARLEALT